MSERITASVLVELIGTDADATGHLSAQVDGRADGLNQGRTQFYRNAPADMAPGFLVWSSMTQIVEAVNGAVVLIGEANTEHDRDVVEFAQAGQRQIEITLDVPARGLPSMRIDYGAWSLSAGAEYHDGTLKSVLLTRDDATTGAWAVGKLSWVGSAKGYRIMPVADAEYVMLLVSGESGANS